MRILKLHLIKAYSIEQHVLYKHQSKDKISASFNKGLWEYVKKRFLTALTKRFGGAGIRTCTRPWNEIKQTW